jgi:hypothetical protein
MIEEIVKDYDGDTPNIWDLNISYINASYEARMAMHFGEGRKVTEYQ